MKIIIDINENVFTRLFDNGVEDYEMSHDDLSAMATAIRSGTPIPEGHGMRFEEIIVGYPPKDLCIYPEYKGKPYFSIKYEENGKHYIGFGTYSPKVLSLFLKEYFMPTIIEVDKEG